MSVKKQVVIVSASPKPQGRAASDRLAEVAAAVLEDDRVGVQIINARETLQTRETEKAFAAMAAADALILVFPLYIFCLPGITMRFLQLYRDYALRLPRRRQTAVYAIVNCGFPEPEINEEASRVVGRFASAVGARYGFGILIGGGGMASMTIPPVRKMIAQLSETLRRVKEEIKSGVCTPAQSVCLRVAFPRRLYYFMGNIGWKRWIRSNGKPVKDLYARPYQQ